jgi:hypothetical protein
MEAAAAKRWSVFLRAKISCTAWSVVCVMGCFSQACAEFILNQEVRTFNIQTALLRANLRADKAVERCVICLGRFLDTRVSL